MGTPLHSTGDDPAGGVAPPLFAVVALPAGRLARLGATPAFHHGLLALCVSTLIVSGVVAQRGADIADALEKGEWHTYSGTFASHRYSPLTQISTANVASLRPVWMYQPSGAGPLEGTPIVVNGVMYVTSGPASVVALDLTSGRPLWQWTRPMSAGVLNLGFPRVNRGVAVLDDKPLSTRFIISYRTFPDRQVPKARESWDFKTLRREVPWLLPIHRAQDGRMSRTVSLDELAPAGP